MAVTNDEPLYVDGVCINTLAYTTVLRSGRWAAPGKKGRNVPVPARHGSLWVAGKSFTENVLTLDMLIHGADVDGNVPAEQHAQVQDNVEFLLRLFTKSYELLHLEQHQADGTVRECFAECTMPFSPAAGTSAVLGRMGAELRMPAAFWRDTTDVTWESALGVADGQTLTMPPFEGGSAPMDDLVYLVVGPADNPELKVHASGAYTRYTGSLAAADSTAGTPADHWRVNSADWTSVVGPGIGFTGTGTNVIGQTIHGGSARLVDLPPLAAGDPAVVFGGANTDADTQVQARGRRAYLLA